jgi:hypothetical protein
MGLSQYIRWSGCLPALSNLYAQSPSAHAHVPWGDDQRTESDFARP